MREGASGLTGGRVPFGAAAAFSPKVRGGVAHHPDGAVFVDFCCDRHLVDRFFGDEAGREEGSVRLRSVIHWAEVGWDRRESPREVVGDAPAQEHGERPADLPELCVEWAARWDHRPMNVLKAGFRPPVVSTTAATKRRPAARQALR